MAVLIALEPSGANQHLLKRSTCLAQVVQQGGQQRQQVNVLAGVPVVLVLPTQDVARGGVGGYRALRIEAVWIANSPQQLAAVQATYPVACHGGVFAGGFAQQAAQGVQPVLGDGRLPGAVAASLGELIEDAAGFGQRTLVALGDQQHIHASVFCWAIWPTRMATPFSVSIMKSSDSLRVRASMQA